MVTLDTDLLQEYRQRLAASVPAFVRPRRFVCAENWAKATSQGGTRYVGMFRENEPDLPTILTQSQLLILGEPGAGKSTAAKAVAQHLLAKNDATVPILSPLKSYNGNLRALLIQSVQPTILDAPTVMRTYILDGIDEVPTAHRDTLREDLRALVAADTRARIVLTARQAYYAQHPNAFPDGCAAYHLIEFDDDDIRARAEHVGVDTDAFLHAAGEVDADEELRNPFVLTVMLERYQEQGHLGRTRSENVDYAVQRLIQSRPQFNSFKQRRALKMFAVACETAARNDKSIDRLQELAFQGNTPLDTWLNAITYLQK